MSIRTATRRLSPKKKATPRVHTGSGNVFADLGLPDAQEYLAKAELAHQICSLIRNAGLTQSQAARLLKVDQPKVSALMRGHLKDFATERLIRFITSLNHDVVITIRRPEDRSRASVRVLVEA